MVVVPRRHQSVGACLVMYLFTVIVLISRTADCFCHRLRWCCVGNDSFCFCCDLTSCAPNNVRFEQKPRWLKQNGRRVTKTLIHSYMSGNVFGYCDSFDFADGSYSLIFRPLRWWAPIYRPMLILNVWLHITCPRQPVI